jgi:hypothetical protein
MVHVPSIHELFSLEGKNIFITANLIEDQAPETFPYKVQTIIPDWGGLESILFS